MVDYPGEEIPDPEKFELMGIGCELSSLFVYL